MSKANTTSATSAASSTSSAPQSPTTAEAAATSAQPCAQFFAFGDFGNDTVEVRQVAALMNRCWTETPRGQTERFVLLLGDNVYPSGINSPDDERIKYLFSDMFPNAYPKTLKVPYYAILGNHDVCSGNPSPPNYHLPKHAQVLFSNHKNNPFIDDKRPELGRCWRMPDPSYDFSIPLAYLPANSSSQNSQKLQQNSSQPQQQQQQSSSQSQTQQPKLDPKVHRIHFLGMDTNAAHRLSDLNRWPELQAEFPHRIAWFSQALKESNALFKLAFAHHPLYTKSVKYGRMGDYLRLEKYKDKHGMMAQGVNFESGILVPGGVNWWLSGHEHCCQQHRKFGIDYFVAGLIDGEGKLFGGDDPQRKIDFLAFQKAILRGTVTVDRADRIPRDAVLGNYASDHPASKKPPPSLAPSDLVCIFTIEFISINPPHKVFQRKTQVKPLFS